MHTRQPLSYVRRGNRLQGSREKAWQTHHELYLIEPPRAESDTSLDPSYRFHAEEIYGRSAPLVIDIGSGLGHAVVHGAQNHPERDFLALDVYLPGLAQTMKNAATQEIRNLRVMSVNAPELLRAMPEASVTEIWTFFPDPWPKARHHKRRLLTTTFAQLVERVLTPGGVWRVATDWEDYAESVLELSSEFPLTNPYADQGGWAPRFTGRIETSFERKGIQAGRVIRDLEFHKPEPITAKEHHA